jgi:hypothetical protein
VQKNEPDFLISQTEEKRLMHTLGRRMLTAAVGAITLLSVATIAATPAGAAVTSTSVASVTQPTLVAGATGQAAGNWTVTQTGGTNSIGDTLTLQVDDSAGPNCAATGDTVGFTASSVPAVAVTSPTTGTIPAFSAALSSSAGACTTAGVKDILTLTVTASGPNATLTISGVSYDIGTAVDAGAVAVGLGGNGTPTCAAPAPGCSNATIALVQFTAPPTAALSPSLTGQSTSPFVLKESQAGAVPLGFVCFDITSGNATFTASNTPTVAASGGGAAAGTVAAGSTVQESFQVTTASSTAPATYTLSGVKVDTTAGLGSVLANAGTGASAAAACLNAASGAPTLAKAVVVAVVEMVNRFGGSNRFDTARLIGDKTFPTPGTAPCAGTPTTPRWAIIARGDKFPDALAGRSWRGARRHRSC